MPVRHVVNDAHMTHESETKPNIDENVNKSSFKTILYRRSMIAATSCIYIALIIFNTRSSAVSDILLDAVCYKKSGNSAFLDLHFDVSKSVVMRVGPRLNKPCAAFDLGSSLKIY